MPTVSFPCVQCGKMMAVDSIHSGKAVRCPHCKAVLTAPADQPAPEPAPEIGSQPAPKDEDSIFVEHVDEDLFGRAPKPSVQIPPSPPPPPGSNSSLEPTVFQVPGATDPNLDAGPDLGPTGPSVRRAAPNNNMVVLSALVILVPYCIFVTAIAIYLYFSSSSQPHPFEMLPDDGEPKATRQTGSVSGKRFTPTAALPPNLIVPLGQTLTVGDLQVTPVSVEEKSLTFNYRTGQFQPSTWKEPSLVLNLELKNISKDVWFRPTDPRFDHLWKASVPSKYPLNVLPYTHLTVNGVYFCSPIPFDSKTRRVRTQGDNLVDEYVSGQEEDSRILGPGDTMKTVICTDPKDQVPAALPGHTGKLLWRVKLRRGLVKYDGRERSAAFVFGVEFDKDQIVKR